MEETLLKIPERNEIWEKIYKNKKIQEVRDMWKKLDKKIFKREEKYGRNFIKNIQKKEKFERKFIKKISETIEVWKKLY